MSLVSLTDMKTYLGIIDTSQDVFLQQQLDIISASIEGYCGRVFSSASYTQTYQAQDFEPAYRKHLFLFHYPVSVVTSVKEINGDSSQETILATNEYLLQDKTGKIKRKTNFNRFKDWFITYGSLSQVEIIYTSGYATIPLPIQDVVYSLVTERYNKNQNGIELNFGNDVQRVSIPGVMSIDFDYTLQANERSNAFGMILGNYANVLDMYRSERVLTGEIKENYVV